MVTYQVIGLTYTRRCPLFCNDCITESSPRAIGKMNLELALACLQAMPAFCDTVSFTGGEPLLYPQEIIRLTREAHHRGLHSAVVTGAGWVANERRAQETIGALAEAGLKRMTISWDEYHEEHSPRWRAVTLARIATEKGIEVRVTVVVRAGGCSTEYQEGFDGLPVALQFTRPIRLGAAATLPDDHFYWTQEPPHGPCSAVLKPLIDCDGTVYACCGPSLYSHRSSPLILGHAEREPLDQILRRAQEDPILEVIALVGPYGLYRLLQEAGLVGTSGYQPRQRYSSICDLCLDITNRPELVQAVRQQLTDRSGRALVAAARMWHERGTNRAGHCSASA
jgi:hypothetical protein